MLVLLLISLGGILALMSTAQRYSEILGERAGRKRPRAAVWSAPRPPEPPEPLAASRSAPTSSSTALDVPQAVVREVDALVTARRALRAALDRLGGEPGAGDRLARAAQERALAAASLDRARYAALCALYREWLAGAAPPAVPFTLAFEARAAELRAVELGRWEDCDLGAGQDARRTRAGP